MNIKLSKEQYEALLKSVAVSSYIYGIMWDLVDEKHQDFAEEMEQLQSYLLTIAKEAWMPKENYEIFDGELWFSDTYMDVINEEIAEYTDFEFMDTLAREMAQKELEETTPATELSKMDEEKYMTVMAKLESKYSAEFTKNGIKNLKLVK